MSNGMPPINTSDEPSSAFFIDSCIASERMVSVLSLNGIVVKLYPLENAVTCETSGSSWYFKWTSLEISRNFISVQQPRRWPAFLHLPGATH